MYPDPLILPPQAVAFTNAFSINSRLDTRQHIHGNVVPISDGNFFIGKKCAHKRPEVTKYFFNWNDNNMQRYANRKKTCITFNDNITIISTYTNYNKVTLINIQNKQCSHLQQITLNIISNCSS